MRFQNRGNLGTAFFGALLPFIMGAGVVATVALAVDFGQESYAGEAAANDGGTMPRGDARPMSSAEPINDSHKDGGPKMIDIDNKDGGPKANPRDAGVPL
jgi:hypothetical protein